LRDWLGQRPAEKRHQPFWWDDPERGNPLCPAVGVSWFEAMAYCRWLTAELRRTGAIAADEAVRLPTEEEWERAVRGTDGRRYPWGEDFDASRANAGEGRAGDATAVATYPQGVGPMGLWDGAGNVWEWTASWYTEGRTRVLRGGSFFISADFARCAYRNYNLPGRYSANLGFRVVVVPPGSPS